MPADQAASNSFPDTNHLQNHPPPISDPSTLPTPKRLRHAESPALAAKRAAIAAQAHALRRAGVEPNTLFFPELPPTLKKDIALRTALGDGVSELKCIQAKGKKMAWATFDNSNRCMERLLALRMTYTDLKVSLHRPRSEGENANKMKEMFDARVREVMQRGGLGNTLMLRNLPLQVEVEEMGELLAEWRVAAVRVRTAVTKGGGGRNFWAVYASVEKCGEAFVTLYNRMVSFRCGKRIRVKPNVHDDSTDVDENKRRARARALGNQKSTTEMKSGWDAIQMLENVLRQRVKEEDFVFLHLE